LRPQSQIKNLIKNKQKAMTEVEQWDKLFFINPNNEAYFLLEKGGLPIKRDNIDQSESIIRNFQTVFSKHVKFIFGW
jgi:hypothetical protein